jgi:hypothetical protein
LFERLAKDFNMRVKAHNERCADCKKTVEKLLLTLFGSVEANKDLDLPSKIEDYRKDKDYGEKPFTRKLEKIHKALQSHRGFDQFVKIKKLPRVDYFVPSHDLIVEFDESQHFTKPREIALGLYPTDITFGFSLTRWQDLCQKLHMKDNDPPYRDEQRAWYDTLRDFAPTYRECGKTIRLYSRDFTWCSLNPEEDADVVKFQELLEATG